MPRELQVQLAEFRGKDLPCDVRDVRGVIVQVFGQLPRTSRCQALPPAATVLDVKQMIVVLQWQQRSAGFDRIRRLVRELGEAEELALHDSALYFPIPGSK